MVTGPVHFIHLGGPVRWQHLRAVTTAMVHGEVWWWGVDPNEVHGSAWFEHLDLPDWLRDHPIKLANVKDFYAYSILHDHGGMYLDFDTISLRPAWDLLPADKDLCVSTEYHSGDDHPVRNNSAVMIAKKGSTTVQALADLAFGILKAGVDTWGAVGPQLVSKAALMWPDKIEQAPYPALSGWNYHTIQDYYDHPRDPGEDVRVIHLYSSSYLTQFENDRWMP